MSEDVFDCHSWGTGCCWHLVVEARDAAKHLKCTGQSSQQRIIQPNILIVPRLRKAA